MIKLTREEHIKRHKELHSCLDELMADMINHTKMFPSETTVLQLADWAYQQIQNPTEEQE